MSYDSFFGKSTELEDFNQLCVEFHLEATVQSLPNPGSLRAARIMNIKSFGDQVIKVIQENGQVRMIPEKGEIQFMLLPDEQLPTFERME